MSILPTRKQGYSSTDGPSEGETVDLTVSAYEDNPRERAGPMSYSINRASWPRKNTLDLAPDYRSSGNPVLRWSVASCSVQPKPGSGYHETRYLESTPYNSVYHYDSALTGSSNLPGGGSECYRYSLPLNYCVTSQESDDMPNRRQFSYSSTPGLDGVPEDPLFNAISTSESPLNSTMDLRMTDQDIPAIFHRGGGRRASVRLSSGNFQDLSVLTMNYPSLPQSPRKTHTPLSRRNSHSSVNVPSNRLRHLSDSHSSSALLRSACQDMESDELSITAESSGTGSLLGSDRVHSLVYRQYHRSYDFSTFPSSPSTGPGNGSEEVKTVNMMVPHQDCIPVDSMDPIGSSIDRTDEVGNLLRVLLAISSKYDFSRLSIRCTCNCHDLNPNAPPNARLCYDYLNTGKCKRDMAGEICRFRHLPPNHIDSVVDKIRNGKMPVCLIRQCGDMFYVANMPGYDESYPGELNQFAQIDAELCLEFNLSGICPNEKLGRHCPYRHLVECHPERVALLYQYGRLTEFEANAWLLCPCAAKEVNPFGSPHEKMCYDFLNTHVCKRNQEGKICRFRHCLPSHEDAVRDRMKNAEIRSK